MFSKHERQLHTNSTDKIDPTPRPMSNYIDINQGVFVNDNSNLYTTSKNNQCIIPKLLTEDVNGFNLLSSQRSQVICPSKSIVSDDNNGKSTIDSTSNARIITPNQVNVYKSPKSTPNQISEKLGKPTIQSKTPNRNNENIEVLPVNTPSQLNKNGLKIPIRTPSKFSEKIGKNAIQTRTSNQNIENGPKSPVRTPYQTRQKLGKTPSRSVKNAENSPVSTSTRHIGKTTPSKISEKLSEIRGNTDVKLWEKEDDIVQAFKIFKEEWLHDRAPYLNYGTLEGTIGRVYILMETLERYRNMYLNDPEDFVIIFGKYVKVDGYITKCSPDLIGNITALVKCSDAYDIVCAIEFDNDLRCQNEIENQPQAEIVCAKIPTPPPAIIRRSEARKNGESSNDKLWRFNVEIKTGDPIKEFVPPPLPKGIKGIVINNNLPVPPLMEYLKGKRHFCLNDDDWHRYILEYQKTYFIMPKIGIPKV